MSTILFTVLIFMHAVTVVGEVIIGVILFKLKAAFDKESVELTAYENYLKEMATANDTYSRELTQLVSNIAEKSDKQVRIFEQIYDNLLVCWDGVEKRYSDTYEQLKLLYDEVKKPKRNSRTKIKPEEIQE